MELTTESRDNRLCLHANGEMTIYHAAELTPQLLDALAQSDAVEIDLSGVSELDASGVQLMMLMKREAGEAGKTLTLSGHSPAVLEVFEMLDLGGWFGDPQVLPAHVVTRRSA